MEWSELLKLTIALLAIVDPLAGIPLFVSATAKATPAVRKRTARIVSLTVFCVLTVAALAGGLVLKFFGISLPSFMIGGGLLLILLAVSMLQARETGMRQTPDEALEAGEKDAIAVVPLGIPLLAGPGAISTMIIASHQLDRFATQLILLIPALLVAVAVWFTLAIAQYIARRFGRTGMNIVTRVMGLFLAAIGVEYVYRGIIELFPKLL